MIELYLSTLILYSLLAIAIGFGIGRGTLIQDIKKGETFNFLYMFNSLKLKSLFEWIYTTFSKILKAVTGLDIDPPALKK